MRHDKIAKESHYESFYIVRDQKIEGELTCLIIQIKTTIQGILTCLKAFLRLRRTVHPKILMVLLRNPTTNRRLTMGMVPLHKTFMEQSPISSQPILTARHQRKQPPFNWARQFANCPNSTSKS